MKHLLFLLLFIPALLSAQNVYDLKRCIEIGLENNYDIKIVRNQQQIAENNATAGNAGYLPKIALQSDYSGKLNNLYQQTLLNDNTISQDNNTLNQAFNAGIYMDWTIFDGLNIQTNHQKLKELREAGEMNTRLAIENFIANLSSEYYNYIQQNIQLENLRYAVALSKERLRIVEERYNIGSMSRLDLQQAKVDFNADSSRFVKQKELVFISRVSLNRLMGMNDVEQFITTADTAISAIRNMPGKEEIWQNTLQQNTFLQLSEKDIIFSELDLKQIQSVNYPYLKLNAGYGYTYNRNMTGTDHYLHNAGLSYGVTLGFTIFDGMNRKRQQNNAKIEVMNKRLTYDNMVLALKSDFSNLWMAYENNRSLLYLETENVKTAEDNYSIALERYKLGDLSGIELREAQNSLLGAEERLVQAEYNTKLCELSLMQISGRISELLK